MRKGRDGEKKKGGGKGGKKREKTDGNCGHYAIASSRPPERRPLDAARSRQKWQSSDKKAKQEKIC